MRGFAAAARLLPKELRAAAESMPEQDKRICEELRLRRGRCASALLGGKEKEISGKPVTGEDILRVMEAATGSSLHAAARALAGGVVSAPGGVRVGVCGTAADDDGLRAFSSLSVRVPRQVRGCADTIWEELTRGGFSSALILSPPGGGKTTLLREICRRVSDGGMRVCIADERGEIADAAGGEPGMDIMTGIPRARAAMMLLRAMNPQILAMDEITDERDAAALMGAAGSGVKLLATVHGGSAAEVRARPVCRALFDAGAFSRIVIVENHGGKRTYRTEAAP